MEAIRAYRQLNSRVANSTFSNQNVLPGADVSLVLERMNEDAIRVSATTVYRQENRDANIERKTNFEAVFIGR